MEYPTIVLLPKAVLVAGVSTVVFSRCSQGVKALATSSDFLLFDLDLQPGWENAPAIPGDLLISLAWKGFNLGKIQGLMVTQGTAGPARDGVSWC